MFICLRPTVFRYESSFHLYSITRDPETLALLSNRPARKLLVICSYVFSEKNIINIQDGAEKQ